MNIKESCFHNNWTDNDRYFHMLSLMASLSNLYTDSETPFIHYRVTENLFCKYYGAENISRTDTAYDAKIEGLGIGIKTFLLKNDQSIEKIAEFNALSKELKSYSGLNLAKKLGQFRNERIDTANVAYGINDSIYHIIGRAKNELIIFNTKYEKISVDKIHVVKDCDSTLSFTDGKNDYVFNRSKSVLMKRFKAPIDAKHIHIDILDDPYRILEQSLSAQIIKSASKIKGKDYVILPLYAIKGRKGERIKYLPEHSELNQWNANGRKRDINECYIPIPAYIRNNYSFFPDQNIPFTLILPDGKTQLSAKICQQGGKALMSNPNKNLGKWILRDVLKVPVGTLATLDMLNKAGFDSVIITKIDNLKYKLDITSERYSDDDDNYNVNV